MFIPKTTLLALVATSPFAVAAEKNANRKKYLRAKNNVVSSPRALLPEEHQRKLAVELFAGANAKGNGNGKGKGNGIGNNGGKNPDTVPGPGNPMGTYVVSFDKDEAQGLGLGPLALCDTMAGQNGGGPPLKVFYKALEGCSVNLPLKAAKALQKNGMIKSIEPNGMVTASTLYTPESWGLDRIDQLALPLDNQATKLDAAGTRVYIVDTGVQADHNDLSPSISSDESCHFSSIAEEPDAKVDGSGHGTHVASTACGVTYGVSQNCEVCAVKVLAASGSGSYAGVIEGIEHVMQNCPAGETCVANMSLGGGFSSAVNQAVANAHDAGIAMVVAAGNSNQDACLSSPASEPKAVTVGSTASSDARSSFSNYGSCVDVYAPGSSITAAWPGSPDSTNTISGTSMASPHVAGIAAGLVGLDSTISSDGIVAKLLQHSTRICSSATTSCDPQNGYIDLATTVGLCEGCTAAPSTSPTPAPPTPAPTLCVGTNGLIKLTTDSFPSETTWTLTNDCDESQVASGGQYGSSDTLYTKEVCLPDGEYTFEITDTYGDGICCSYGEGSYVIEDASTGAELIRGGEFGSSESRAFVVGSTCEGSTLPPAPSPLTSAPTSVSTTTPPATPPPVTPITPPPSASPTVPLTSPPTTAPPAPTPPPSPMVKACNGSLVGVRVVTDSAPEETAFAIRDICGSDTWTHQFEAADASAESFETYCLPVNGRYEFTITDSWGDGLADGAYYQLYHNTEMIASGGDFERAESYTFGAEFCS